MDRTAEIALAFINNTDRHVFLTGKAGSGKTTFLRSLQNNTHKKMAITAPTGIAAVNASGVTLHSLFQLPTSIFLPGETQLRVNVTGEKRLLLRELELLVIDEVSMLRADILDAIDHTLRDIRKQPGLAFGGVQLLYIGDLYQLSPVSTGEELRHLEKHYNSLYFTSSKVFASSNPVCISLEHIYRQTDPTFISVLNGIREGKSTKEDIELLNKYSREGSSVLNGYVTLVTHNQAADKINSDQLSKMRNVAVHLEAVITGEFDESIYPTEKTLQLKVGAQVMLLRNDRGNSRKYFNGKMGTIYKIESDSLVIDFENKERIEIQRETWQNIRYEFDQKSGVLQQHEIGSFTQFPVRLAWAITIHKSQGLTFDQAVLDVQKVFSPGQTYVAFSRVRSLKGLILKEPVDLYIINSNASSLNYVSESYEILTETLETEKIIAVEKKTVQMLDWGSISDFVEEGAMSTVDQEIHGHIVGTVKRYQLTNEKFFLEIRGIIEEKANDCYNTLSNRVQAACQYYLIEITELLDKVLTPAYNKSSGSVTRKLQHKFVKDLIALFRLKRKTIEHLQQFVSGTKVTPSVKKKGIKKEVATSIPSTPNLVLSLFAKGLAVQEIANQLKLSVPSIENYLAVFISSGELHIRQLISASVLEKIIPGPEMSALSLKNQFGDALTFGQINALLNYFKLLSG